MSVRPAMWLFTVGAALILGCGAPSSDPSPVLRATSGTLVHTLELQGELRAREALAIVNPISDHTLKIAYLVEDGSRVEADEVVVRLDAEPLVDAREKAARQSEIARTKAAQAREKLRNSLGAARAAVVVAELDAELARMRQTDSEAVPRLEREQTAVAAAQARLTTESAAEDMQRIELEAVNEVELLELEALRAEQRIARLDGYLGQAELRAPRAGLVLLGTNWRGEKRKVGDESYEGHVIASMPQVEDIEVVAWVHEVDSPRIAEGQVAQLRMDAHPGLVVEARVASVAPIVVPHGEAGVQHLRTVLLPLTSDRRMKPGMTVSIVLETARVEEGVLVPSYAVRELDGRQVVYTPDGTPAPVQVLVDDGEQAAVEGIEVGQALLALSPADTARGVRLLGDGT